MRAVCRGTVSGAKLFLYPGFRHSVRHAPPHTAAYRILQNSGGTWLSEGREHFSLCHRCGRWVSDLMYNPNTLQCVDCSPWEEQPAFCPHCGVRVQDERPFCLACGKRLQYGEEESDGSA